MRKIITLLILLAVSLIALASILVVGFESSNVQASQITQVKNIGVPAEPLVSQTIQQASKSQSAPQPANVKGSSGITSRIFNVNLRRSSGGSSSSSSSTTTNSQSLNTLPPQLPNNDVPPPLPTNDDFPPNLPGS